MRGNTPARRNAEKLLCKNGHPLSGDNLALYKQLKPNVGTGVARTCRICHRDKTRRYRARKAQESVLWA